MSEPLQLHLGNVLKKRTLKPQEHLLKEGEINNIVCFITKGLLHCYIDEENRKVSTWFMKEGDVIFSVESFYLQIPSYEAIVAMEESEVYYITKQELNHINKTYLEFNFIGRELTEKYYMQWVKLANTIRSRSAQKRYQWLLGAHPDLMLRVPGKDLASFIGVTDSTYSHSKRQYHESLTKHLKK